MHRRLTGAFACTIYFHEADSLRQILYENLGFLVPHDNSKWESLEVAYRTRDAVYDNNDIKASFLTVP